MPALMLLRPFLPYAVAFVAFSAICLYIHQRGVTAEREEAFKRQIAVYIEASEKASAIASGLEADLSVARKRERILSERLKNEVIESPVYTECILPANGLRILNATRADVTASASGSVE